MEHKEHRELDAWIAVNIFGWEWLERLNQEGKEVIVRKAIFPPLCDEWIRWNFNPKDWVVAASDTALFSDWDKACSERADDHQLQSKRRHGLPNYSTDPAAAMEVLKKCILKCESMGKYLIPQYDEREAVWFISLQCLNVAAPTLELAICLFAKQLFSEEKNS